MAWSLPSHAIQYIRNMHTRWVSQLGGSTSIKYGLLSLLAEGENHGYQLKVEFERRTGGTWPVNIGQVYTTLDRLVRDGLADRVGESQDGQVVHRITDAGRTLVRDWFRSPVEHANPPRNELAIKFALAAQTPG